MCLSDSAGETCAQLPVVQHDGPSNVARAFGVPDVAAIDLSTLSPADQATLINALQAQLRNANVHWNALLEPVRALIQEAYANIFTAISESGGTALAHEYLDVHLETKTEYVKDVAVLRTLADEVPAAEFTRAIYRGDATIKASLTDEQIKQLEAIVGAPVVAEWKADARQLNSLTKKYGEKSKVGKIIAKGCRKVQVGSPYLVITEREQTKTAVPA